LKLYYEFLEDSDYIIQNCEKWFRLYNSNIVDEKFRGHTRN